MCVFNETCGTGLALEHNGDLYSCDHFVEPKFLLGNLESTHMLEMVASPQQMKFGQDKRDALPEFCRTCDVRFACHGECPKNRFLRDEVGADWMQFIPVVERINADGQTIYQEGDRVSDRSVLPEQFGRFLATMFDEWVRRDVGRVFVQTFEASLRNWLGMPTSGMCVFNETCGTGLALEHNGDLYSCDHFVEPKFLLGNIENTHMLEMVASPQQARFGQDKRDALPEFCRTCDVRFACHGECPKNRFLVTPDGEPGLNYLCAGFKLFFHHVDYPMKIMAGLIRRNREAKEVMEILERAFAGVRRNDPCPCGSGRRFGRCHGAATNPASMHRSSINTDESSVPMPGGPAGAPVKNRTSQS
jgi:radical SAM protein with 4Fe4S-binding SPASM domain